MLSWASEPVRPKKAIEIPKKKWEQHKEVILREFYAYGLAHVREYMLIHYQFTADHSQWNYRLYKVWKAKRSQPPVPQPNAENGTSELANVGHRTDVQSHYQAGGVLPPATIHEEDEDETQHVVASQNIANIPETASFNDAMLFLETAGRRPSEATHVYTGNITQPSLSSRSASLYERNDSAASSYYQQEGCKRTASVSSQSSAPSSKRFKRAGSQHSISTPIQQEDEEEGLSDFPQLHGPLSVMKNRNELHNDHRASPSESSTQSSHRPGRLKLHPLITRKEIIFLCSSSTSKPTTFVRIRTVNPYALPDQCTDDETIVDITSLQWKDMHQLKAAAEIFTACRMYRQAFKMHYQIWSRLKDSQSCPWGDADELMLKQILACSRTPETKLDLRTCRRMLIEQLDRQRVDDDTSTQLHLRMALADICMKQGDWNGAREHRANACEMLCEVDDLPVPNDGNPAPDFIADHVVLRAYALRASMDTRLRNTKGPSKIRKQDEKNNIHEAVAKVWLRLACAQRQGIMKILRWCRNQLRSITWDDLTFLRGCFGPEPSSTPAVKRLNVAALFGLFLMRKHGTSSQHEVPSAEGMFGSTAHLSHGLNSMEVSSAADVLWIMAAVIVECMAATTIASVLSNAYFDEARKIATNLMDTSWTLLSDRINSAMKVEFSPLHAQQPRQSLHSSPNDPCLGAAAKLVMAIVRRDFGVVLEGFVLDLEEPYQPIFSPTYHAMSIGLPQVTDASARSKPTSETKFVTQRSNGSVIVDLTAASRSERSTPWSSMKRIREQMKQHSPSSWKDSMQKAPSKFIRDAWKQTFGRAPSEDDISESLASTTISDIQSPRESVRLGMDLNSSSRFKRGLTLKTFRDIHELVDQLLLQH